VNERYQRHSLIDWFNQTKLREAKIVVVGTGATGNEVLKNLALLGVGHLQLYDFDKIEDHNLTRCVLFRERDVGRFKAEVAAEACRDIDPNIEIVHSTHDFWDDLSLGDIARADAVMCCVDNFEARLLLNKLCLLTSTDFYEMAIDSRFASVMAFPFSTHPDCACYECSLPAGAYSAIQKRYSCGWLRRVSIDEKKIPTTTITSSLCGAIASSLVLNTVNGHPQAIQGAVRYFQDAISLHTTLSALARNDDCPTCKTLDPTATRIVAKRQCLLETLVPIVNPHKGEITFSEPVAIRGVCKQCGRTQEYFESSRRLTDAITFCSLCKSTSCEIDFVERITLPEFTALFAGRNVPSKFVTYSQDNKQVIIEMENEK